MQGRSEGKIDADLENKWGFLKNIVNIDVFFAGPQSETKETSKADDTEKSSAKDAGGEDEAKPKSKPKSTIVDSEGNEVKKSSIKEKAESGELEDAIEKGEVVTDSQGNIYPKSSKKAKADKIKQEIEKLEKKKEEVEKDNDIEKLEKQKESLEKAIKKAGKDDSPGDDSKDSKMNMKNRASSPEQRGKADKE